MEVYLVGGAVRDELLGMVPGERDWVVVGATPQQMMAKNFMPVGKDFPVFLHPDTHEEYALARTERKTARGYHGFQFFATPEVTLQQDLQRRDITVNAIAKSADGELIDPYGGQADVKARVLRHVSPAFSEDPVRILRVARLAAHLYEFGFSIADETQALMRQMVADGEVDALTPERVWTETRRALGANKPSIYFTVLYSCGALQNLFPELSRLWGVPQPERWHPEIDTGVHTMMVLDQAARLTDDTQVRYAALTHDLGKGTTAADILPSHHGHEKRSAKLVNTLSRRYRTPKAYRELAMTVAEYHGHFHKLTQMKATTILRLLYAVDAFRRPERFNQFLLACEADSRGRTGFEDITPPQTAQLRACYDAACAVDVQPLVEGLTGAAARTAIDRSRAAAIAALALSKRAD